MRGTDPQRGDRKAESNGVVVAVVVGAFLALLGVLEWVVR